MIGNNYNINYKLADILKELKKPKSTTNSFLIPIKDINTVSFDNNNSNYSLQDNTTDNYDKSTLNPDATALQKHIANYFLELNNNYLEIKEKVSSRLARNKITRLFVKKIFKKGDGVFTIKNTGSEDLKSFCAYYEYTSNNSTEKGYCKIELDNNHNLSPGEKKIIKIKSSAGNPVKKLTPIIEVKGIDPDILVDPGILNQIRGELFNYAEIDETDDLQDIKDILECPRTDNPTPDEMNNKRKQIMVLNSLINSDKRTELVSELEELFVKDNKSNALAINSVMYTIALGMLYPAFFGGLTLKSIANNITANSTNEYSYNNQTVIDETITEVEGISLETDISMPFTIIGYTLLGASFIYMMYNISKGISNKRNYLSKANFFTAKKPIKDLMNKLINELADYHTHQGGDNDPSVNALKLESILSLPKDDSGDNN